MNTLNTLNTLIHDIKSIITSYLNIYDIVNLRRTSKLWFQYLNTDYFSKRFGEDSIQKLRRIYGLKYFKHVKDQEQNLSILVSDTSIQIDPIKDRWGLSRCPRYMAIDLITLPVTVRNTMKFKIIRTVWDTQFTFKFGFCILNTNFAKLDNTIGFSMIKRRFLFDIYVNRWDKIRPQLDHTLCVLDYNIYVGIKVKSFNLEKKIYKTEFDHIYSVEYTKENLDSANLARFYIDDILIYELELTDLISKSDYDKMYWYYEVNTDGTHIQIL